MGDRSLVVRCKRRLRSEGDRRAPSIARVQRELGRGPHIALTFDDGPDPRFTPAVLDVLAQHGANATFFVVGEAARRQPDLVREIADRGHAVGSHSMSHPDPWTLGSVALRREYREGRRAVEDILGRRVRLFRPPKGYLDFRGACSMRAAGVRPWLWTDDPCDWRPGITADEIAALSLNPGAVVLLHDGLFGALDETATDRRATVAALDTLLQVGTTAGLRFVSLPE